MATNIISASMEATCKLCSQYFSDPRLLPCLHTFCFKCLLKRFDDEKSKSYSCPSCMQSFEVPDGGIKALQKDIRKVHETEFVEYEVKMKNHSGVGCDRCKSSSESTAVTFCCNCCKFLCGECKKDHLRCAETYEHELVDIGEDSIKVLIGSIPHKTMTCQDHSGEVLKFYCETCSQLICCDCVVLSHKDHTCNRIEKVAKKETLDLNSVIKEADGAAEKLEDVLAKVEKVIQNTNERRKVVDEQIVTTFEAVYKALREREQFLLARNSEINMENVTALKLQCEEISSMQKEIQRVSKKVKDATQSYTPTEILASKNAMSKRVKSLLKKYKSLHLGPCKTDKIDMSFANPPLLSEIERFGKLGSGCYATSSTASIQLLEALKGKEMKTKVITRDIYEKLNQKGGGSVCVSLRFLGSDEEQITGQVTDNEDGTYFVSITPQNVGEHILDIRVGDESIQCSPFAIFVREPRRYTSLSAVKYHNASYLVYDVAVKDNEMFMARSGNNDIFVQDKISGTSRIIGSSGSGNGQFNHPFAIALQGNVLYVVDQNNHRIQKLSTTGEFLSTFGSYGSGDGQLNSPHSICISREGKVYVTEYSNNRISIFNTDGSFDFHITGNLFNPRGITFHPSGNLHVANYGSHDISVFTLQGKFVKKYGSRAVIPYPAGIVIDPEGNTFITEFYIHRRSQNSSRLFIFDPQFKALATLQAFNYACGVTIDREGSIYVCDSQNNRVVQF